ncbi:ABC transporter-like,P-loop containing nucleoside triphosphate hydrolase,AAA+ ATPase domain,ABC [Cinara cedri]|uniref:ABC transporter-like,P-loop containing nucleoside triphosphate hydrolase,AAA+ ATPase domain,ABC n=1 Tax=Cinara cedri TaxID=506608 RepID=A0A5E4MWX8_9HEMI|nr:ABC transporter-like,P-loop containing nucleoside triphosphate hydrolase,AAA+ ATPase domain,ABC [Cinara cedri]
MWLKIKALLWKSFQLRKRYWLSSILEIIVPCLLFCFLKYYLTKINIYNDPVIIKEYKPPPISEQQLYNQFIQHTMKYFIYTPKTLETEEIMKTVANKLLINLEKIDTAKNESDMIQKMKNVSEDGFGIVFQQIIRSYIFKYKIRNTKDVWFTNYLFLKEEGLSPINYYYSPYFYEGFLSLQLALDKAFISLDNNNSKLNNYNLEIQSYPHAEYTRESKFEQLFKIFLPLFTVLSFLLMCSYTIKRIVEEKDSGVKELMKMMGLKSWMIWTGWILHNFFVYAISITLITSICCFKTFIVKGQLLNHTNPLLFWIFLVMYMIAGIFFSFSISSVFNRPLVALIAGSMSWCLSYSLPTTLLTSTTHIHIKTFFMLFPNYAVTNAFNVISSLESQGIGLQFSTLFTTGNSNNHFSVGFILIMFIIDCFLYGFIAWYIDLVMPGKYGIAKPLYFFCNWFQNKTDEDTIERISKNSNKLYEKPPEDYEVGISVLNLYKRFGNLYAVNGVNLDLYKGQITALLGQNGAGKTTTMSIITGLFSPSFGSVKVNGNDLFSNFDQFRDNLGFCPQNNLLFPYLTTLDHLIFFGLLKGMLVLKVRAEGIYLLKLLNLLHKKDELVSNLSGGMKRKLSLAIALVGNPEILILDEPTSGMDPESRREIWDLLLSFRGSRTILITTHFMEEADVLGDRIAIMDRGQVKCYGTSLFLKKVYGTGYNLTILKEEIFAETKIIAAIKEIIPEADVHSTVIAQIVINLPNENIDRFPDLFKILETNGKKFGIKGMGLSCTTIEEVFLRAKKNIPDTNDLSSINTSVYAALMPKYVSGINLIKNQFKVLMKKKILYTYRRLLLTTVFSVGSILLVLFTIHLTNYLFKASDLPKGLNLSLSTYMGSTVYYRSEDNSSFNLETQFVDISKANYATVNEVSSKKNIFNSLLAVCNEDTFKYRRNCIVAGNFNKLNSTVMYNNIIATHAPAIAINLYTNALLHKLSGNNEAHISTINEPVQLKNINEMCINRYNITYIVIIWLTIFTPGLLYLIGHFMALPLNERVSGIKHLQMMTTLSPIMYWFTCFLWDYFCYIIVIILLLTSMYISDIYHIFTGENEIIVLIILLLIYGWSSIFYAYVFSFFKKDLVTSMLLFISINFTIGMFINNMLYLMKNLIRQMNQNNPYNFWNIMKHIALIIPHFSYSSCITGFIEIAWHNNKCKVCKSPDMPKICQNSDNSEPRNYFEFESDTNPDGILKPTLCLLFSGLLYISIILIHDYKIFACLYQMAINSTIGTNISYKDDNEDPDVSCEQKKVDAAKNKLHSEKSPILVVDDLVKKFSFKFSGVRGISFAVDPGECFGLLGVNGAGKTTIFRILTGDIFPSKGDAFIQTDKLYKLSFNTKKYVSMIGYCPQFNAINDKLTARETLYLMAILRGVSPLSSKNHVDKWIKLLGLEEYKDRPCGKYSEGNKRKLSIAIALIGNPPIVFLDEPTSGVDPVARRNLWQLLAASQRGGQTIVLTSHSMDECEALCNRLTIMVDGVMKCIGNIQYLKNRYAQGFTVMVKLRNSGITKIADLKTNIEFPFAPYIILKDEHKGLLHYHITNQHIQLSNIFCHMKAIKDNYNAVEDFIVGDTTLEQVFLAFAKRKQVSSKND